MKLPKFIFDRVKMKNTSLGDNPALPPEEDYAFEYTLLKTRFKEVCQNFISYFKNVDINQEDKIISLLNERMTQCQEIESSVRPQLEKLCENTVVNLLQVPSETVIYECHLVDTIEPKHNLNVMPESASNRDFDFNDLTDYENVNKVILKRRFLNALIQGAANDYTLFDEKLIQEINQINPSLNKLYKEINILNDLLLFIKEEKITDKHKPQGACVEVEVNGNDEKTIIYAQGKIFPLLLQESLRGFFELFTSHGLPQDNKKANYILRQADFLLAEPWDMRIGVPLWKHLVNDNLTPQISPYFFMMISCTPVEEFNVKMREMLAKTKVGKEYFQQLKNEALHDYEMDAMVATINLKNDEENLLNDSYISAEELDDMVIEEDDEVVQPTQEEMLKHLCADTDEYGYNVEMYKEYAPRMYSTIITVNNQPIPREFINLRVENVPLGGYECYHLHINVDPSLRHLGCAFKTYKAFIRNYGHAITLFTNRANSPFEDGRENKIEQTWQRLMNDEDIQVGNITDSENNTIGYLATWGIDEGNDYLE